MMPITKKFLDKREEHRLAAKEYRIEIICTISIVGISAYFCLASTMGAFPALLLVGLVCYGAANYLKV